MKTKSAITLYSIYLLAGLAILAIAIPLDINMITQSIVEASPDVLSNFILGVSQVSSIMIFIIFVFIQISQKKLIAVRPKNFAFIALYRLFAISYLMGIVLVSVYFGLSNTVDELKIDSRLPGLVTTIILYFAIPPYLLVLTKIRTAIIRPNKILL